MMQLPFMAMQIKLVVVVVVVCLKKTQLYHFPDLEQSYVNRGYNTAAQRYVLF